MFDPALGLAVVFNGCIYNFRDLRRELEQKGYRFFSACDTEVILKAYHAWGPRCVERFLGMFAFAIWERDSGRVVLARDRLGIKPLYLAETNRRAALRLDAAGAAGRGRRRHGDRSARRCTTTCRSTPWSRRRSPFSTASASCRPPPF